MDGVDGMVTRWSNRHHEISGKSWKWSSMTFQHLQTGSEMKKRCGGVVERRE
jgi:hypothetical protein